MQEYGLALQRCVFPGIAWKAKINCNGFCFRQKVSNAPGEQIDRDPCNRLFLGGRVKWPKLPLSIYTSCGAIVCCFKRLCHFAAS